jgi:hypothetical protein
MDLEQQGTSTSARAFAVIGIVVPVFYILFVTLLGLRWEGYNPIRDTQSELGAVDSPFGDLMNIVGFMGIGLALLAFAVAYGLTLRSSLVKRFCVFLIVVAGVSMVVVGFFPCDAGCVDVTRTGRLHGTFSAPAAIALPVAAMLSSLAFRRDGRFGTTWEFVSFWLGLLTLATGPIVAAGLAEGMLGLIQRVGMWLPFMWTAAVSWKLYAFASRDSARV